MSDSILLSGSLAIRAALPGERVPTFAITPAYTGGPLVTTRYPTGIIIDLSGLTTNDQAITATIGHDDDKLVGHVESVKNDGRSVSLAGVISAAGPAADELIESSKRGFPWHASVEARPLTTPEFIGDGEAVSVNGQTFSGPVLVARRAELFGVSFVPRGADEKTSVTIAAEAAKQKLGAKTMTGKVQITFEEWYAAIGVTADDLAGNPDMEQRLRDKYDEAMSKTKEEEAQVTASEVKKLRAEIRAEQARRELDELRASRPLGPSIVTGRNHDIGRHAVQAAFFKHLGHESIGERVLGEQAMEAGASLRCSSMVDIIKCSLTAAGQDIPASRDDMIRAAFSTTDLAGMLGASANKLLLDAYQAVPSVARIIAKPLSANNFKQHTGYRVTGDNSFRMVPPSGEIQHGKLSEQAFAFRVDTYARMFGITRTDIINDDLGAFASIPQIIGRGAATKLEEVFWQLVLANTGDFFDEAEGNYQEGVDTALAIDSLTAAVTLLRRQVDTDGAPVMVAPKYLVVPPELETPADGLYTSRNIAVAGVTDVVMTDGNPHERKYQPLIVPHLSNARYANASLLAWYLFGDPADVAAFGIAYLNGVESPVVEAQDAPFNTLGMQYRGYLDFGVCQIDPRGGVMSKGEAE